MRIAVLLSLAFLLPSTVSASVIINEVAWMGTSVSANAEWLELYNNSNSVIDITGWRLVADNGSPSIILAGGITANGFFLLERTSDASVPSVTANQIYTGALTNSGTRLTLSDISGAIVDTVDGGANWANIGGDNASKNTAQRTSSGWLTATPTPGAINHGVTALPSEVPSANSATTTESTTGPVVVQGGAPPEYVPIPTLRIVTGKDRTVSTGADTPFTARVYDSNGNRRSDVHISWSFGDGGRRTGESVYHSYYEPGEYIVIAHATTPDGGDAFEKRNITVLDASIKITGITTRGISLTNGGQRSLDLSLWRLVMGGKEFKIPENTQILAGRTILFPAQVIQLPLADSASLLYPSGETSTTYPPMPAYRQPSQPVSSFNNVQAARLDEAPTRQVEPVINSGLNKTTYENETVSAPTTTPNTVAAVGAALPPLSEGEPAQSSGIFRSPWFLGLLGVIALAGTTLGFL